ncbi:MAG: Monosaccharide-transporting ATPase [Nocardioides sp.]|jgi:ribose transport system ATP-binding protein|nr:Monosaccharide-transporting ATPase [Nocardioides sp.]
MSTLVELQHLTMTFNASKALDDVSLEIQHGEVHGLLGHNGSGKSTLIRVLAGVYTPDRGRLAVNGRDVPLPIQPDSTSEHGLAFVHQGLGLAGGLSVLDNLAVANYERSSVGRIDWRRQRARAVEQLRRFGVPIALERLVSELEPVEQAIVAIARAMTAVERADGGRLLVLDEPTVYLPRPQVETLFGAVRELVSAGDSVLFVSHRIQEVLRYTDRVSVLRNGRLVATEQTSSLDERRVVRLIVGRDLDDYKHAVSNERERPVATVSGLTGKHLRDVSFEVGAGEILGVTGLAGSGFGEIPYLLYGALRGGQGALEMIGDSDLANRTLSVEELTPLAAQAQKIVLIPADRAQRAIIPEQSVQTNVSLPAVRSFFRHGLLNQRQERSYVRRLVDSFDIRLPSLDAPMSQLSGGNQQKAVLAKWLSQVPRLVLMDEPTQGVDVAGRLDIWNRLRTVAETGAGVIIASESAEELAELCDRVLVFRDGEISRELTGTSVDKHVIADATLAEDARVGGSSTDAVV